MGKVSEYAFINAKLRARIGEINSSTLLSDMVKAPTLNEAISTLKNTRYSRLVSVYAETGDLQAVELALLEFEIETYREVLSYLKGNEKELITVLLEKVEVENIKNAFRLWYSSSLKGRSISSRANYIFKKLIVHPVNYSALINARSFTELLSAFEDTIYYPVISSFNLEDIKNNGLFDLEIKLDHLYFDRLFSSMKSLKWDDRKISEDIYFVDVDLKNILLFIRYNFYHHVSASELEYVCIPYGRIYEDIKRKKLFEKRDNTEEIRSVFSRHYKDLMTDLREIRKNDDELTSADENAKHIIKIEEYLSQTRKKEFMKILTQNPFTVATILSYFFLLRDEDQRIRSIMSAKFYKWDEERIREAIL